MILSVVRSLARVNASRSETRPLGVLSSEEIDARSRLSSTLISGAAGSFSFHRTQQIALSKGTNVSLVVGAELWPSLISRGACGMHVHRSLHLLRV